MCARTTCSDCSKPDWRGCGAHIEAVLGDVPKDKRCGCREDGTRQPPPSLGSMISSLFGLDKR